MVVINDIPASRVGEIVQSFVNEGKTDVRAERQSNGRWRISAS
jgi:hypothetical protein